MICITIAQTSRRLALADMLNAAQLGADLLEVRLDCFERDPNIGEIFTAAKTPILISCRRPEDGGSWDGTEEERQMLLRQAIVSKADYVEMELDIADKIPHYPGCQRVISYTNLRETPNNIAEIYAEAQQKRPDIIKLTCRARTPEEAWPLVQILDKPPVPTVVVGLGRPGAMLAVLGRRIGAPWTAAALERGMEAYPGQPTIRDLEEIYHYRAISPKTMFVGVTGLSERSFLLTGLINAALAHAGSTIRCLPMQVGEPAVFKKVMNAVRLKAVVLERSIHERAHHFGVYDDSAKAPVQAADILQRGDGDWSASNLFGTAAVDALGEALGENLQGRSCMLVGAGAATRMIARPLKERGASLIFACKERDEAARLSQLFGGRQVPFEGIYSTTHDVLIIGGQDEAVDEDEELPVHPGYLKAGMTVMDLTMIPRQSPMLREARQRGASVVDPAHTLVAHACAIVKRIIGEDTPFEVLTPWLRSWLDED